MKRFRIALLGVAAFALVLTACGGGGDSPRAQVKAPTTSSTTTTVPPTTTTIPDYISFVATVNQSVTNIGVFASPDQPTPSQTFPNPWEYNPGDPSTGVPQTFLVKDRQPGWVEVLLPVRPNGSTGWVHASDVTLTTNSYHIVVQLGAHTITVTNAHDTIYTGPVAVGAPATPTPVGSYYLYVLLQAPDPSGPYGPYAYGLSSHSDALESFDGGDAEIGIHGNNDASVLGSSVSHGCIRMDNAAITDLAKKLPLGTPVDIVA